MYRSCSKRETTTDFQISSHVTVISLVIIDVNLPKDILWLMPQACLPKHFSLPSGIMIPDKMQNMLSPTRTFTHHFTTCLHEGSNQPPPLRNILNKRTFSIYTTYCIFLNRLLHVQLNFGGGDDTLQHPPIITAIYIYIFGDG